MADIYSLPAELIRDFDDHIRLLLAGTCRRFYSLLPEYEERITYPQYIHALDRKDFMYLYRHESAHTFYMREELNLEDSHLFVKYLRFYGKRVMVVKSGNMSDDVIYACGKSSPAMYDTPDKIDNISKVKEHNIDLFNSLAVLAFKTKHPKYMEYFKINNHYGDLHSRKLLYYHLIKCGLWEPSMKRDVDLMHNALYAYGYVTIEEALSENWYEAIAAMSHDYPDITMKYVIEQKPIANRYRLLEMMASHNSCVFPTHTKKTPRLTKSLLSIIKDYPTKDVIDALEKHSSCILSISRFCITTW